MRALFTHMLALYNYVKIMQKKHALLIKEKKKLHSEIFVSTSKKNLYAHGPLSHFCNTFSFITLVTGDGSSRIILYMYILKSNKIANLILLINIQIKSKKKSNEFKCEHKSK